MMAPGLLRLGGGVKFVGVGSIASNTGTGVNIQQGTDTKVGDLLVGIAASVGSNAAWTPVAGFTEIFDPASGCDAEAVYAAASQAGVYGYGQCTTSTSNNKSAITAAFRKAAYDAIGSNATLSTTGSLVIPSVTLSKGGVVVALVASGGTSGTHSPPGSMQTAYSGQPGGGYPTVSIFYEKIGAGASGTRTVTIGGTPGNSTGVLVALIKA
ncbi:MAG: hypothetical protein J7496_08520 [Novosphingobium sp.]|nr:hypothetical protein [Novosphingobium sp.]